MPLARIFLNLIYTCSDNGDLSPNTVDNESCKSNDGIEYSNPQRNVVGIKVSPYSEEGTLVSILLK